MCSCIAFPGLLAPLEPQVFRAMADMHLPGQIPAGADKDDVIQLLREVEQPSQSQPSPGQPQPHSMNTMASQGSYAAAPTLSQELSQLMSNPKELEEFTRNNPELVKAIEKQSKAREEEDEAMDNGKRRLESDTGAPPAKHSKSQSPSRQASNSGSAVGIPGQVPQNSSKVEPSHDISELRKAMKELEVKQRELEDK